MRTKGLTYKGAGVDIRANDAFKEKLKGVVRRSLDNRVLKAVGGFGSMYALRGTGMRDPVLVSSADGVGTKLKIALLAGRHDSVGIDAVAMNVNDILCTGARTLFFLDYIAYSKLDRGVLLDLVRGLTAGCRQAGCSLIGGETAQMPQMYAPGEYDLAGFCVGVVERRRIIDGSAIRAGDLCVGIASSGLHSNGFSLVRAVFSRRELQRMSRSLLEPTRIYCRPVLDVLAAENRGTRGSVRGLAHITGGAFFDKITRILPEGTRVTIRKSSWEVPGIFRLVQARGGVAEEEMYHTLNMGIGMVLVVEPAGAERIRRRLAAWKLRSWIIGDVRKGRRGVELV